MATIDYLLSVPKLQRLQSAIGSGNNALIISLEQTDSGEFQVKAKFKKVKVTNVPQGPLSPAEPDGSEKLCPVPPGCDSNGNCSLKLNAHMVGTAEAYTFVLDDFDKLQNNEEVVITVTPVKS